MLSFLVSRLHHTPQFYVTDDLVRPATEFRRKSRSVYVRHSHDQRRQIFPGCQTQSPLRFVIGTEISATPLLLGWPICVQSSLGAVWTEKRCATRGHENSPKFTTCHTYLVARLPPLPVKVGLWKPAVRFGCFDLEYL